MTEEFAEDSGTNFDFGRVIDAIKRRHMQFLLPLMAGWLAVWLLCWILPVRYRSTTLILVQEPTMPKDYVAPNVSDDLQSQLQSLQQQILSRTRLLTIINKFHLYLDPKHPMSQDQLVARMQKDIGDPKLIRDPQNQITSFQLSYSAPTPQVAQKVTGELANLFITQNLRQRQELSRQNTSFIEEQVSQAWKDLSQQDARVRAFEMAHQGALPKQQATNLQILSGLQAQLQNEQNSLSAAQQQQAYYGSLIAQYRSIEAASSSKGAAGVGTNSLNAIDKQITALRAQLADDLSRYTSQYPEVQTLKAQIADAVEERKQLISQMKSGTGAARAGERTDNENASAVNMDQSSNVLQLESQLKANQIEIANRKRALVSLTEQINTYQSRLNDEPAVEQQLADLTRGYEQSQTNYNSLLQKENDSKMATSMEQMQQGERFTILDPPNLPSHADFPNRLKFSGIGIIVGLALGALVVGILELMDDRLRGNKEIEDLIEPVTVLSEVPEVISESHKRTFKRKMFLGWSVAVVVFLVICAGTAFSFLHA